MIRASQNPDTRRAFGHRCGLAALLLGLALPFAQGAQVVEGIDGATLYVKISKREITRIALDRGRIASLRVKAGELAIEPDEDTGQLFVSLPDGADKPVNAFLTTSDGITVTLLLQPADVPADSVIIRRPSPQTGPGEATRSEPYVDQIRGVLTALANDDIPRDAELRELSLEVPLWREVVFTLHRQLVTAKLVGERYLLTNRSGSDMVLEERELYKAGVKAVAASRLTLAPEESTPVYIVRERRGND